MLSADTLVHVTPGIASAVTGGETTVLDPATGQYFGFEDVGARIWALLGSPISVEDLAATLHAEYEVPADECYADVLAFTEELVARGLVRVVRASGAA